MDVGSPFMTDARSPKTMKPYMQTFAGQFHSLHILFHPHQCATWCAPFSSAALVFAASANQRAEPCGCFTYRTRSVSLILRIAGCFTTCSTTYRMLILFRAIQADGLSAKCNASKLTGSKRRGPVSSYVTEKSALSAVGPQPRTGMVELLREQSIYELRLDLGLFRIY